MKKLSRCLVQCGKVLAKIANDRGTAEPKRLKGRNMAEVETTIDSIRCTTVRRERIIVLKQKGADHYLPFWVSSSQADILAMELQGRSAENTAPDLFLAKISSVGSNIECVTIRMENDTFYAKLLLYQQDKSEEVKCPIGIALALAYRAGAPILVDEALFDKAGVTLSHHSMPTLPKQPWWRRVFKRQS